MLLIEEVFATQKLQNSILERKLTERACCSGVEAGCN